MDKVFNLKIDSKVRNINIVQGLKQFENNSILNITLLQNSLALDLTNCTVRLNFIREDKRVFLYMADIVKADEGKVSIKLSPEVLKKVGDIQCDISVFDSNLLKITSATFKLIVEKSIYSNDYYLNMKDFDIVQRMHIEEEARIKNEKARIESENTRTTDEKKRSDAESLRSEKENERISNEEKRVQSESKRSKDEQIRNEAEDKRKEYEKNRLDQEEARVKNEKLRSEAEDKRKIAENTRADNELGRITYEGQREANEKVRIQSELNRVAKEDKRTESEEKRLEAEKLRIENESERINSEITRVTDEQKRVTNETNRIKAEKTRVEEWNNIKDVFNNKAPGDMKTMIYDKNGNGKVDIAELAESVEWKNVKDKPNLDDIGKVKSINSKTGDVILKAIDIKTEDGTNLEDFKKNATTQYEEITQEVASLTDKIPSDFVQSINGQSGKLTFSLNDLKPHSQIPCIYVDANTGNDDNSGDDYAPFKTVERAIIESNRRRLFDFNEITIFLKSNITNEPNLKFYNFNGSLNLQGHTIKEIIVFDSNINFFNGTIEETIYINNSRSILNNITVLANGTTSSTGVNIINSNIKLDNLTITPNKKIHCGLLIQDTFVHDIVYTKIRNTEIGIIYEQTVGHKDIISTFTECDEQTRIENSNLI